MTTKSQTYASNKKWKISKNFVSFSRIVCKSVSLYHLFSFSFFFLSLFLLPVLRSIWHLLHSQFRSTEGRKIQQHKMKDFFWQFPYKFEQHIHHFATDFNATKIGLFSLFRLFALKVVAFLSKSRRAQTLTQATGNNNDNKKKIEFSIHCSCCCCCWNWNRLHTLLSNDANTQ